MAFSNTILYEEEWAAKLQERLNYPQNWKDFCDVRYSDTKVLHIPYMSTIPAAASLTRGTAYSYATTALTDASLDIATPYIHATAIDRADLAQSDMISQMSMAETAGILLNEQIESAVMASYASFTSFDNTALGGGAGNITVTEANIDNIIRAMKREVLEANGGALADKNGMFIVWRAADFEKLEAFVQANGFVSADHALKNGIDTGFHYAGVDHFVSNSHTANHLIGGVKKTFTLGILKATYGQVVINQDPYADTGVISGVGVVQRVDYGVKMWENLKPVMFDIKVA